MVITQIRQCKESSAGACTCVFFTVCDVFNIGWINSINGEIRKQISACDSLMSAK